MTPDFDREPEGHRYWSEQLRSDPMFRRIAEEDADVGQWLRSRGLRWEQFEARGGSRRYLARPARDRLHVSRGGSNTQEARRWNADLANFRRIASRAMRISHGQIKMADGQIKKPDEVVVVAVDGDFVIKAASTAEYGDAVDLDEELGADASVQAAYFEFVRAGCRDREVTARDVKERKRRWTASRRRHR